jgi:hypothetical protein
MMAIFVLETLGELPLLLSAPPIIFFFRKPTIPLRLDLITSKIDLSLSAVAIFWLHYFLQMSIGEWKLHWIIITRWNHISKFFISRCLHASSLFQKNFNKLFLTKSHIKYQRLVQFQSFLLVLFLRLTFWIPDIKAFWPYQQILYQKIPFYIFDCITIPSEKWLIYKLTCGGTLSIGQNWTTLKAALHFFYKLMLQWMIWILVLL